MVGYRIPKEAYYLQDPGLAPDELAALHLAASAVRLEGANGVEALWKLGGELAEQGPAPAGPSPPCRAPPTWRRLFAAISARRRVVFAYRGRSRRVDPWRLSFRNGHWYLAGFDHDAGEERMFRLDRVESDVAAAGRGRGFRAAAPRRRPAAAVGDGGGTSRSPPGCWSTPARRAGPPATSGPEAVEERRPDGSVVLAVRVTNRDAFRSFVLGFLDHAEVLGPPELRADMVEWLEAQCGT